MLKVKQHERQAAQLELGMSWRRLHPPCARLMRGFSDQLKADIETSAKEIEQAHKALTAQKKELTKTERELEQAKVSAIY